MKKQYKNTSSESLQTDWKSGFESPESRPCFPDWAEWRCKTGRTNMSNGRSERAKQPFRTPHYGRLAAFLGHQKRLRIFKRLTDSTLTPALKFSYFRPRIFPAEISQAQRAFSDNIFDKSRKQWQTVPSTAICPSLIRPIRPIRRPHPYSTATK